MSINAKTTVCGFIGLGSQGAPIARRIIDAGLPSILWARRDATLDPFRDTPAKLASTVEELAAQVDYVGICVFGDEDVTEVCDKLLPAMKRGSVIAIHSTVLPETCQAVAAQAAACGVQVVDAPVSGGKPAAEAGALTVMLGGESEVIARIRPILETFSGLLIELGEVGAAQKAKLINNSLMAANMGLAHLAVSAGTEQGLNREALLTLLKASSGRSFALDTYARYSDPRAFSRITTLIEKIDLLGKVLGQEHETCITFQAACKALAQLQQTQPSATQG